MYLRPWNAGETGRLTPTDGFRSRMERLFGEMESLFGGWGRFAPEAWSVWPALNVWEAGDSFVAEAEIPGAATEDVEILANGAELTIKVRRPEPELPEGAVRHRRERPFGEFTRTITLPAPVDADKVAAGFRDGVLTLTMPKHESAKPRRIEVRAAGKALAAE